MVSGEFCSKGGTRLSEEWVEPLLKSDRWLGLTASTSSVSHEYSRGSHQDSETETQGEGSITCGLITLKGDCDW